MIICVRWDSDGSENVVSRKDIKVIGGGRVVVGSRIKMWWGPEGRWYKGTVTVAGRGSEQLCTTPSEENSEENIPLSTLISRESVPVAATLVDEEPVLDDSLLFADEVLLTEAVNKLNSSSFLEENLGKDEVSLESVVSADVAISKIMESGHKSKNTDSGDENEIPEDPTDPDYVPEYVQELNEEHIPNNIKPITSGACHTPLSQILKEKNRKPEAFDVEGNAKQPLNDDLQEPPAKSRKLQVKYGRLTGSAYTTVSGVEKPAKKILKQRCNSNKCSKKGLGCELITEDRRNVILSSFYDQVSLTEQRNWLSRHIKSSKPSTAKENSRKTRTLSYYLPIDENGDTVRVCHVMFVNTINVSDRMINTVILKTNAGGTVEVEKRGGRSANQATRDTRIRNLVKNHINRFPRMESHYVRANSSCEYLSDELTVSKMFEMYTAEHTTDDKVNLSFYYKVFKSLNLKFTRPKKDLCGLCETFYKASEEEKTKLVAEFNRHTGEKQRIRNIKHDLKENTDDETFVGCFDLQQVIFLPKSDRGELFYKRRLSNYNFTIYDVKTNQGYCYVWHEGLAKRGANEISSNLAHFLQDCDAKKYKQVFLFCDGCGAQNKNSIVCAMLIDCINKAKNIEEVVIFYFETNHGQSEGDSIHSVVERALKRVKEIVTPSQLSGVIRMASKKPYHVVDVDTNSIQDFKELSQTLAILRVRLTDAGVEIRWPDFKQLKITKQNTKVIYFKYSHTEEDFHVISLPSRRNLSLSVHQAYANPPSIAEAKYTDLMSLCSGTYSVIKSQADVRFYSSLHH